MEEVETVGRVADRRQGQGPPRHRPDRAEDTGRHDERGRKTLVDPGLHAAARRAGGAERDGRNDADRHARDRGPVPKPRAGLLEETDRETEQELEQQRIGPDAESRIGGMREPADQDQPDQTDASPARPTRRGSSIDIAKRA